MSNGSCLQCMLSKIMPAVRIEAHCITQQEEMRSPACHGRNKNNSPPPDLHRRTHGRIIQGPQDKGLRNMKINCPKKRHENGPARERDRTAEGKAETHRGIQKAEVTSSEPPRKRGYYLNKSQTVPMWVSSFSIFQLLPKLRLAT